MPYVALDVLNCIADSLDFLEDYIDKCKSRKELEEVITKMLQKKGYVIKRSSVTGILSAVIDVQSMPTSRTAYAKIFLEKRPKDLFRIQFLVGKVVPAMNRIIYAVGFIPVRYSVVKDLPWDATLTKKFIHAFAKAHKNIQMPDDMKTLLTEWSSHSSSKKLSKFDIVSNISRLVLGGYFEYEFID